MRSQTLNVRMTENEIAILEKLSVKIDMTKSEIVRLSLKLFYQDLKRRGIEIPENPPMY